MGNPIRFIGSGSIENLDGVTLPPHCMVEVTFRCHQQQFLMRPDEETTKIILGCFGRAYSHYPELKLHIINVLSNHGSFLASPLSTYILSEFMRDFLADVAKKLNLIRNRNGTFFERRYRCISVLDEAKLDERFEYVLTQGTKENLVDSARDWPGVNSIPALLGDNTLIGQWRDKSSECILQRQRKRKLDRAQAKKRPLKLPKTPKVYREYEIKLHPMPHWKEWSEAKRKKHIRHLLEVDDKATKERHAKDGTSAMGIKKLLHINPFDCPENSKKSPAPFCHASTRKARKAFRKLAKEAQMLLRRGREKLKESIDAFGIPPSGTLAATCNHEEVPKKIDTAPLVLADGTPIDLFSFW